jgi:hypothetical protein
VKYFGADATGVPPVFETKVDKATLIASLSMTGFALLYSFVNGDWGPGIPGPKWLRRAIEQPKPNADMTDEAAALMGDDLAVRDSCLACVCVCPVCVQRNPDCGCDAHACVSSAVLALRD